MQKGQLNVSLLMSPPVLLADPHVAKYQLPATCAISALAEQLADSDTALLANSSWNLASSTSCWLPQHYVLVPAGSCGLLAFRRAARSSLHL